ncbi:MAG: hypothetical protein QM710_13780 [Flavobacterium sp.]
MKIDKNQPKSEIYKIILRTEIPEPEKDPDTGELYTTEIPGEINGLAIKKLNEPMKALASFYSAMGGSYCSNDHCNLTTELDLGKQGSKKHKNLIQKYFPNDKVAEAVIKQDCYLRPSGASTFSDYEFLTILDKGDTITVDYRLMYYDHGEISWAKGPDIYLFKDNKFKKIKRNLWTFIEK